MDIPKLQLNSGSKIPAIGFGTWNLTGKDGEKSISEALKAGYRLIDTAKIYGNEDTVGKAVSASGVHRGDIFVTTKLWPSDFVYAEQACKDSLKKLGTDYIDLYLIHWPNGRERKMAWSELQKIKEQGLARAIGVSNYTVDHLKQLMKDSDQPPAVNQIEFHPFIYKQQQPVLEFCRLHSIIVEAYSPLAQGNALDDSTVVSIANRRGKSPAQVMLRWAIQHGTVPIPRSSNPDRIKSNLDVLNFELTDEDMAALDDLS
jgi:diketogulonate reductase-like aldo/keto reductase